MSAVVIDGGVVHYEYLGRGGPIIFIHGWLGSWRYWMSSMGELSDSYRTYALDLWGFGDTDKMESRYTLSEYVQLGLAFMDELGIVRAPLIVGHSLGAIVALEMALNYPEMVSRLAVVSLPFDKQQINTKSLMDAKSLAGGSLFKKSTKEYEPIVAEADKTDRHAIELSVSSLNGFDVRSKLCTLQVPTLMVYGAKDSIVTPQMKILSEVESSEGNKSMVRTMFMPQSRHFPMLEEASTFNRLLRDFLLLDVSDPEVIHSLEFKEEWRRRMR